MPTICPKCQTVRPADAAVPDWQCPACGVAYAKAGGGAGTGAGAGGSAAQRSGSSLGRGAASSAGGGDGLLASVPWGKLLAGLAIAYGAWIGFQKSGVGVGVGGGGGSESYSSGNITTAQLAQLAANTPSSDIVMYSATWCPNCTQAKSWMAQYGFKPQVCETDKDSACQSQLKTLDPQGGVPYLIVKGHHMKDGFDSQEFVAALVKQ